MHMINYRENTNNIRVKWEIQKMTWKRLVTSIKNYHKNLINCNQNINKKLLKIKKMRI